jgi:hypothetical protein
MVPGNRDLFFAQELPDGAGSSDALPGEDASKAIVPGARLSRWKFSHGRVLKPLFSLAGFKHCITSSRFVAGRNIGTWQSMLGIVL